MQQKKPMATGGQTADRKNIKVDFEKYQSLIIFLFAFLLYANTLGHGFVLDDGLMIKDNKFTLDGISGIGDIFTHDQLGGLAGRDASAIYQGGRYRPLSQVLFAIEVQFFKLNPHYFHWIHVLMYALLCMLVFITLKKIFVNIKAEKWYLSVPFIAALLFAAHPIHTEVAANVKSADELMCMLGAVLSLYFSINFIDRRKYTNLILAFIFLLFAIFSKENAITFIAVIPLTIFIFRKTNLKTYLILLLPLLAAAACYFLVRLSVMVFSAKEVEIKELFHNPFLYANTAERYATVMLTWLKYLLLLLFPHPLTHDYYPKQIPIIGWNDFRAILSVLIYAAVIIYAVLTLKEKSVISYGILFFLITFSVTSNLVINLGLFMNERFMLLPSLGFIVIVAYFFVKGYRYFAAKNAIPLMNILFFGIVIFYSAKTFSRNRAWESDDVLFATDVKTSVNSGRINVIEGSMILADARREKDSTLKKSKYEEALGYINRGLEIYDGNMEGWNNFAEISIYLNNYGDAETALERVLNNDSVNATALNNLFYVAYHYQSEALNSKALRLYEFLNSKKSSAKYFYNIAVILENEGETDSALAVLDQAISVDPDYYDAYNLAAEYYATKKNNYAKSLSYLEKAYKRNDHYTKTIDNLGNIYAMKGDYRQSLAYFEKAVKLDSTDAAIYQNMAISYRSLGNNAKAKECLEKAVRLTKNK